jgi:hypothetical protein
MTKLSPHGSRSPLTAPPELSEEDRLTYRRWVRGWYVCCSIFMVGLLAVGLSTRAPRLQASLQGETVGSVADAHSLGEPRPGR